MPLRKEIKKVLVIGSGPIVIGQAAEFDYAGTQACLALKEEGIEVVLINSNPATIMTDPSIVDKLYLEPLTVESIEQIVIKEKPDGIIGTLGGQTGLNLAVQLEEQNLLQKYGVELLGTSIDSIQKGEDRELFRSLMLEIGEPIPESAIVTSYEEGLSFVQEIGFPVIIRPAYTLGGAGGGFAHNEAELELVLRKGLRMSPIHQVLVERSIKGWKEVEYEVMRDANDTCIIVCNMENMDPVGVHTGDSIVVAPSQTLTDVQYQILRNASLKVIRSLQIIGGCNIQFALDPHSNQYYIIEVNPRVSRSSALASKATGYPIARVAAKCAVGYHLDEILNPITGSTYASFEPAIDYIVVKLPRFPFDKFSEADRSLGTQMKATGEVMAIDRSFEGALHKGLRSLESKVHDLHLPWVEQMSNQELEDYLVLPTDVRLFAIAEAYRRGLSTTHIHHLTQIDPWFLEKLRQLVELEGSLAEYAWEEAPQALLRVAKQKNMSDRSLATLFGISEQEIRRRWKAYGWRASYKLVDTCAAEFDAVTPYYYSTWLGLDECTASNREKVLVIGSGPIRIGQGIEFDYCSVHAALAVKKKGYEAIVMNNNPETVSTDYSVADKLYFEPLAVEDILQVVEKEQVDGVLIQFGGQTAINVAAGLAEEGVKLLGTSLQAIDQLEDRELFYEKLSLLDIPHISGATVTQPSELRIVAQELGFPVLVRPSYVIGGESMFIFYHPAELEAYAATLEQRKEQRIWPLLVDRYVPGLECEMDVLSDGTDILVPGIIEHIERAGVHSGDSVTIFPPVSISEELKVVMLDYARRIAQFLPIVGIMNIQFVVADHQVYVLEVNPRASRTVPIMSKVTQVPMIEWATRIQLGETLRELSPRCGLLEEPSYYAVKVPVFSASKLREVDHVLGPEMKSTGEVLGLGVNQTEALEKALFIGGKNPFTSVHHAPAPSAQNAWTEREATASPDALPAILCSIAEREKGASVEILRTLTKRGFRILATEHTAQYLTEQGLTVEQCPKEQEWLDQRLKQGDIGAIINIPTQGRVKDKFGFYLREQAVRYHIPCFTSLDTVRAALSLPEVLQREIRSLEEYYKLESILIQKG